MVMENFLGRLKRNSRTEAPHDAAVPFDTYESRAPAPQNCIDAIPGWVSAFPDSLGLKAGQFPAFVDYRIDWLAQQHGSMAGANVLELGPLEAGHTAMLHAAGAEITAVEANKQAFLRCLVTKELLGLPRAKFLLGDCVQYLEQTETRYDLIVACGVLYHMPEPIRLLEAIAARTDAVYLWTSYIDETDVAAGSEVAGGFDAIRETGTFRDVPTTLYRLNYNGVHAKDDFCGGIYNAPRWMDRPSIIGVLGALGFTSIEIAHENVPAPHQPCFSVFARRSAVG